MYLLGIAKMIGKTPFVFWGLSMVFMLWGAGFLWLVFAAYCGGSVWDLGSPRAVMVCLPPLIYLFTAGLLGQTGPRENILLGTQRLRVRAGDPDLWQRVRTLGGGCLANAPAWLLC